MSTPRTDLEFANWDESPEVKALGELARQLERELSAAKSALEKAREALKDASVGNVIVWRSASTGGCVSPIQEALTAINEVLNDNPPSTSGPLPAPNKEQSNHK